MPFLITVLLSMGKRKRAQLEAEDSAIAAATGQSLERVNGRPNPPSSTSSTRHIQIVVGSYERILHGVVATVSSASSLSPPSSSSSSSHSDAPPSASSSPPLKVLFSDNFLFNAHGSAIRCLAVSPVPADDEPAQQNRILLASGSTDQRINLYQISADAPRRLDKGSRVVLDMESEAKKPRNRELGSLLHHSSNINCLSFPNRSKLLSGGDDSVIAISRSKDWTVLSTIKVPIPKAPGRPSGDTAAPGESFSGVADFAVHPSMKLMISVSKGENCMRLWNLVTGKRAGVLSFGKDLLKRIGERRWSNGDGRRVAWNSEGDEFVIMFERGAVIFGMDSEPKRCIIPEPPTKLHQTRYTRLGNPPKTRELLTFSTEDGRILFYSTEVTNSKDVSSNASKTDVPACSLISQIGGDPTSPQSRIKDFELLSITNPKSDQSNQELGLVIAASSNGSLTVFSYNESELQAILNRRDSKAQVNGSSKESEGSTASSSHIGRLLGTYNTGNRITCLKAFVMKETPARRSSKGVNVKELS